MPSTILSDNGVTSGTSGIKTTGSNDGTLALQTTTAAGAATTALSISTAQVVTLTNALPVTSGGTGVTTSTGTGAVVLGTSPTITTPTISSLSSASATALTLQSAGTTAVTIDTSQFLLYNTTSTTVASASSANTGGINFRTSGASGNGVIDIARTSDFPLNLNRLSTTGGVVNIIYNGSSVGTISTNGTTTAYNTSSDYRLKENIAPMTGALAKVALLKPVTFKWKINGSDSEGFIAHELQAIKPDCVSGDKDATREQEYEVTPAVKDEEGNITTPAVMGTRTVPEYQGVDTSFLVATLTAAIQETKALIDTQAETITAQSATLVALTARIVALEGA